MNGEDKPEVVVSYLTEKDVKKHKGLLGDRNPVGWCYQDVNYPDEGACGGFPTKKEAEEHALSSGYVILSNISAATLATAKLLQGSSYIARALLDTLEENARLREGKT